MDNPRTITEFDIHSISLVDHPPHPACTIKVLNSERGSSPMLETTKYIRKPFKIDAVQVTAANMEEVAAWVSGKLLEDDLGPHVKVRVHRPLNDRQTRAYVGDWVLAAGTGFKVYNNAAFKKSFEQTSDGSTLIDTSKKMKRPAKAVANEETEVVRVVEGDVIVPKRIVKKAAAKQNA